MADDIKRALNLSLSKIDNENILNLKLRLPKCVQILKWNVPANLINEAYNWEYLTTSDYSDNPSAKRKNIFMKTVNKSEAYLPQSLWQIANYDNSESFLIKNFLTGEYLYPNILLNNDRREVFTWNWEVIEKSFLWVVEIVDDVTVKFKSLYFHEYLIVEDTLNINSIKPILTTIQQDCGSKCNWILSTASNFTSGP